jgi:hypothetical protein
MVYRGVTAADVARRFNGEAADLHRFIIKPLLRELQSAFGTTARARFYFGPALRSAFSELMPEHEFEALFRPLALPVPNDSKSSTFSEICSPAT